MAKRRLDSLLAERGLFSSRSRAAASVMAGEVRVGTSGRRAAKPGELIVSNADWHEAQLKEQRLPTAQELDKVSSDNPVVLVQQLHGFVIAETLRHGCRFDNIGE